MIRIEDYQPIIGKGALEELFLLGKKMDGRTLQNINSTAVGGGVAEILTRMIPLLNQLGVKARWDVIKGDDRFFAITKSIHNALHGVPIDLTEDEKQYFVEVNRMNSMHVELSGDFIFIHDPQPIALIERRQEIGRRWVWRGHVDFSQPYMPVWNFLSTFVNMYDAAVFSAPSFSRQLTIKQVLISPSIDPLADKNKELPEETIASVFERFGIDRSRPIITQISRFDYLKDPVGVIRAYKMMKRYVDAQLVLAGGGATDDPEGPKIMDEVKNEAAQDSDIFVLFLPPGSDIEINALQRGSTILIQKSLREGFGLTVTEALWKKKPVVASAVGGIPLQIIHKHTGLLAHSVEGTAYQIRLLLSNPALAQRLGAHGHDHVREHFLITSNARRYLVLFLHLLQT